MQHFMPCTLPAQVCLEVPNFGIHSMAERLFLTAPPLGAQASLKVHEPADTSGLAMKCCWCKTTWTWCFLNCVEASGNKAALLQVRNQNPQPPVSPAVPELWGGGCRVRV